MAGGQASPYTPGQITGFLPGRETLVARLRERLTAVAQRGELAARPRVLIGGRGVGKTSLLRYAQRFAASQGMDTVWVTAGDTPLVPALTHELTEVARSWPDAVRDELGDLAAHAEVTVKTPVAEVKTKRSQPDPIQDTSAAALERLIAGAARASRDKNGAGLVVLVDELQSADTTGLRALAYAWQHLQSATEPVPAALLCAGLGHTSDVVTDAATFGERFDYQRIRDLSDEASFIALTEPADALGVTWDIDAVELVRARAAGYPHFLQLFGHAAWEAAGNPDPGGRITAGAVMASEDEVNEQLDIFYRTRWGKATPAERELLRAIAAQPTRTPTRAAVAKTLGRPTTALSMARRSLMDKGILDSPSRGVLAFTAPGFSDYILDDDGLGD